MTKPLALGALRIIDAMEKDPSISALKKELGKAGWKALISRLGEEPVEYLGSGNVGSAFLLESGRVLKFTNNAELYAADMLMNDYSGERPDVEGLPPRNEPHPNVIRIHDAFALLQKESRERIFGVGVIVKDAVDEVLDSLIDPELFQAAERLVVWTAPSPPEDMSPDQADCWELEQWVKESSKLTLSPIERALRDDLAAGIEYLLGFYLCPPDLLKMSNIGVKNGRAIFFDIQNRRSPLLTEEDVPVIWGLKEKGFGSEP